MEVIGNQALKGTWEEVEKEGGTLKAKRGSSVEVVATLPGNAKESLVLRVNWNNVES